MRDADVMIAARSELAVLISATVREERLRWARFIHDNSNRRAGPFVAIDCSDGLVTRSAVQRAIEQASGGTLFVDDIANVDADTLRLLVNGVATTRTVRMISGAMPSSWTEVSSRSDAHLFYRLNIIHLAINSTIS